MAKEIGQVRRRRTFPEAAQPVEQSPHPPSSARQSITDNSWSRFLLKNVPIAFVTSSSISAAYDARNDRWTLAFIFTAYTTLMLFFWFVGSYETTPPEKRPRHKMIVWVLSTILIVLFPYKLTPTMHFALAVGIWTMAGITISLIFYLFFIYEN